LEDPGEENDLASSRPLIAQRLATRLEEWLAQRRPFATAPDAADPMPFELTPDQIEALRRLGYA